MNKDVFFAITKNAINENHLCVNSEKCYLNWIKQFYNYSNGNNLFEFNNSHAEIFIDYLKNRRKVSVSSLNQSIHAIKFLYNKILLKQLTVKNPKTSNTKLPLTIKKDDIKNLFSFLYGDSLLIAAIIYSSGLLLNECLQLRIKDINTKQKEITVCGAYNDIIRKAFIPNQIDLLLNRQIEKVHLIWEENVTMKDFKGSQLMPNETKLQIVDLLSFEWQFLFPSKKLTKDKENGKLYQNFRSKSSIQKAIKDAVILEGLNKNISSMSLRHSYAVHLLDMGLDVRILHNMLGNKNFRTTLKYKSLCEKNNFHVLSPLDFNIE